MGATVTTGKLAAAYKAASGTVMYVLFEETYEKNVHPHRPHWSCIYIGPILGALQQVFRRGSSAEGGMLQNRPNNLKPETYIAGWLKELAEPVAFENTRIEFQRGKSFYDAINQENLEGVRKVLADAGRQELLDAIAPESGSFTLSLHDDAELIVALGEAGIYPWRLLRHAPRHSPRRPDLGYFPDKAKTFEIEVPAALKPDAENRLLRRADGTWYCAGWAYSIVGHYIAEYAEAEMKEPGSYKKRIAAYREAVDNAAPIPVGTKVVVDETVSLEHPYQRRAVAELKTKLVQELKAKLPVTVTETGYEIDVTSEKELLWDITHLPEACTTWVLPPKPAAAAPAGDESTTALPAQS